MIESLILSIQFLNYFLSSKSKALLDTNANQSKNGFLPTACLQWQKMTLLYGHQ